MNSKAANKIRSREHNSTLSSGAKSALLISMVAILAAGNLLDRELRTRTTSGPTPRDERAALLVPLGDVPLPDVPETAPDGGPMPREPKTYVVVEGDTLGKIAQKTLGTQRAWKAILRLNQDQIESPAAVRTGMRIKIPGPRWEVWMARQSRARAAQSTHAGSASPDTASNGSGGTAPEPYAPNDPNVYVVQKGDTLGHVAQKTLGTVRAAQKLYEHNHSAIANPDQLKVGTRLQIPSP